MKFWPKLSLVSLVVLVISKNLMADPVSVRGYFQKSANSNDTFFYNVFSDDNKFINVKPFTSSVESVFKLLNTGDFVDLSGDKTVSEVVVVDQVNEIRIRKLYGQWKNKYTQEIYFFHQASNTGSIVSKNRTSQFQYTLAPSATGATINMIFTVIGKEVKIFDFSILKNKLCLKLYDDLGYIIEKHEFKKISE